MKKTIVLNTLRTTISLLVLVTTSLVSGAEVLEEVTVTARKRAESLQDVPISITAVSGETLRNSGIDKLENLAPTVPSLHIGEAFGADQFFIRGLGSGVNFGFEQAVGQVIDGFFYGRSRFGRSQFLDIERVEVLKGPQGALLGKNTTAGAINITTARPTDEFEGWATATGHVDGGEGYTLEGAVSGPITDTLMARAALRYEDRDGFTDNVVTGNEDQSVDDFSSRVSILYEPNDDFDALVQWSHGEMDRQGRNMEVTCGPAYNFYLAANGLDSVEDCAVNRTRTATANRNGVEDESNKTGFDTVGLTMNVHFGDYTLTSLTGYAEYDYTEIGDNDRTDTDLFSSTVSEDYEQFTQELRLTSQLDGMFNFILGGFYQDNEQTTLFDVNIVLASLNGAGLTGNRRIVTNQEGETFALFGQVDIDFHDAWTLTLGARYTDEDKAADQAQAPTAVFSTDTPLAGPGAGGPAGLFNVHQISAGRSESDFSPNASLRWQPNDDTMLYASVSTGFKGGGFDHQKNISQAGLDAGSTFEFEEEDVLTYELGGKLTLADGRAQVNFSLFRSEFDDLQVSALTDAFSFEVTNAAKAISQGIEGDIKWLIGDGTTLTANAMWLDAEYDEFTTAPCYDSQTAAQGCVGGVQDLSGRPLQFAPEFSYSASLEHIMTLTDNLEITGSLLVYGQSKSYQATDLDPATVQDSYAKLDARLAVGPSDGKWSIAIVGRNLTDKTTANFINDLTFFNANGAPLAGNPRSGSYFYLTEPPRTISIQGTVRF